MPGEGPGEVVGVTGPDGVPANAAWRKVLDAVGGAEAVAPAAAQEHRP